MQIQRNFYCAGNGTGSFELPVPAPLMRHAFRLENVPRTAPLTVCAPGFYELFVNGIRITRGRLSPYIANPDDFLCCDSYDIAACLAAGQNVVCLILGNGVMNCIGGSVWDFDIAPYRSEPVLALEAQINGVLFTAADFVSCPSAIVFNDLRAGEWYDARLETDKWLLPEFDDSNWKPFIPAPAPRGELRDMAAVPPVLPEKELHAVSFRPGRIGIQPSPSHPRVPEIPCAPDETGDGYIYDFGENTTGVCRLTLKNTKPGQKIVLQYAELLGELRSDSSGLTDRTETSGLDLRCSMFLPFRFDHRDVYICRGAETETWEPYFTCHGFRYCLVIGLNGQQAAADTLTAIVLHSQLDRRADFSCSDETAVKLWEAAIRSDLGNLCHIPTDCPHREKNGWTGDAALSAEQMLTVLDSKNLFSEWLAHVRRSMREDGSIPGIVPSSGWGFGFGPCWDAVLTELPYRILTLYGDERPARDSAAALVRYLHFLSRSRDERGLIPTGLGDWCQAARNTVERPTTPPVFTSSVTAYDSCRKAEFVLRYIGQTEEAEYAAALASALRAAVRHELIDAANGLALCCTQTAQAMAVYYGILEPSEQALAIRQLVGMIHDNADALDCGILGLRVIFRVLADAGYADLAWKMIIGPAFPSYGYWIANGATTLWELFSPIERMQSSCNHHFTGDILCFFLSYIAGIRDCTAFAAHDIVIRPCFIENLSWAEASVKLQSGTVCVRWERTDNGITLSVRLPEGSRARILLGPGMKTDEGFADLTISESTVVRLIPSGQCDTLRRFAEIK